MVIISSFLVDGPMCVTSINCNEHEQEQEQEQEQKQEQLKYLNNQRPRSVQNATQIKKTKRKKSVL